MARHGFGREEYKSFAYPLPELVASFRSCLYTRLSTYRKPIDEKMFLAVRFPPDHEAILARFHAAFATIVGGSARALGGEGATLQP